MCQRQIRNRKRLQSASKYGVTRTVPRYVTELWYTGNPEWEKDLDFAVSKMTAILDTLA